VSALEPTRPTRAELEAELGTALPDKQVLSLLDLNIDIDLALALAAPSTSPSRATSTSPRRSTRRCRPTC
jgi:hypothetical protein